MIGGSKVYAEALTSPFCQTIYLTQARRKHYLANALTLCVSSLFRQVLKDFAFDACFPDIDRSVFELKSVGDIITGPKFALISAIWR